MMVFAIHAPNSEKLETVKKEMLTLGAPTIRVINCGDHFMALEGSHRLAAAYDLGIVPELVIYEQDDVIDISAYDWFDTANWADVSYPAGEVAGELFSPHSSPRLSVLMTPAELKAARHALGLSAEGFARTVGVAGFRTVQRWEAGDRDIPGTVERLVDLLLHVPAARKRLGLPPSILP